MQVSRERYFMTARNFICSRCAAYRVSCDAKQECDRVSYWIDERMIEERKRHEAESQYRLAGLKNIKEKSNENNQ